MSGHVTIGMPDDGDLVGEVHPGQVQPGSAAGVEGVHVHPDTGAGQAGWAGGGRLWFHHAARHPFLRNTCARSRSSLSVIFIAARSPGTRSTAMRSPSTSAAA